jgi:hypothetical protein
MLNRAIWLFFILLRLYKVVDGLRQPIAGENANIRSGEWHTLRVKLTTEFLATEHNTKLTSVDLLNWISRSDKVVVPGVPDRYLTSAIISLGR